MVQHYRCTSCVPATPLKYAASFRKTNGTGSNTATLMSSSTKAARPSMDFSEVHGLGVEVDFDGVINLISANTRIVVRRPSSRLNWALGYAVD